jgi:DNA-binding transcriptional ArsR family regulator
VHRVPDAAAIVGLLADDDRRAVVAALVLGATTLDDVCARTRLEPAAAGKALARLVSAGLVIDGSGGGLHLLSQVFRQASRAVHEQGAPVPDEHGHHPPAVAKVLRAFVVDGRLTQIPAAHGKRQVILDWLAQDFEPGVRYSEAMVNLIIGKRHPDTAALRRYLVDEDYLDRAGGEYWRSGGSALPSPP